MTDQENSTNTIIKQTKYLSTTSISRLSSNELQMVFMQAILVVRLYFSVREKETMMIMTLVLRNNKPSMGCVHAFALYKSILFLEEKREI